MYLIVSFFVYCAEVYNAVEDFFAFHIDGYI